jgi:DNA-binding CsgD family transcriptional regulator
MAVSKEARIEAVKLLISEGWNPPKPNDRVLDNIARDFSRAPRRRPGKKTQFDLTPSERIVLDAAASGLTVQETADTIGIGRETVRDQRKMTLKRLGAKNMTHAVAIFLGAEAA